MQELALRVPQQAWPQWLRSYADGHEELHWAAGLEGAHFGTTTTLRLVVVTPDPAELPEQAYREVEQYLGWTHPQARSDTALRRVRSWLEPFVWVWRS